MHIGFFFRMLSMVQIVSNFDFSDSFFSFIKAIWNHSQYSSHLNNFFAESVHIILHANWVYALKFSSITERVCTIMNSNELKAKKLY